MASTPRLSGRIVDESRVVAGMDPRKYMGGKDYLRGIISGLEIALIILERDGGIVPKQHKAKFQEIKAALLAKS